MGHNGVHPVGQGWGAQGPAPLDAALHHLLDKLIPGIGDQGLPVAQVVSPLILPAHRLQLRLSTAVQAESLLHQGVPLNELDGGPVCGDMGGVGLVVDQLAHLVVDLVGEAVVQVVGLHRDPHMHLIVGHLQQLLNILSRPGGDGDNGHAQGTGQSLHVDLVPMPLHLVHKIQCDHHRPLQLQQLGGKVQIALDIGGVNDVNDGVGPLPHDEVPGHDLLHGIGGQRIDTGQIHHRHRLAVHLRPALLLLHRHAGPVAHVLIRAGEGIEQSGLAAVGVAYQGQLHLPGIVAGVVRLPAVLRRLMGVVGVHAAQGLLVGNVLHHAHALAARPGPPLPLLAGGDEDLGRVRLPQGQLIAPQIQLQRVSEGGHLSDRHLRAGGQSHIHQPALHRPILIAHPENGAPLTGKYLLQGLLTLVSLFRVHAFSIRPIKS